MAKYKNKEFKNKDFDKIVIDEVIINGLIIDKAIFYPTDSARPPSNLPIYKNCKFVDCTIKEAHVVTNLPYEKGIKIWKELTHG